MVGQNIARLYVYKIIVIIFMDLISIQIFLVGEEDLEDPKEEGMVEVILIVIIEVGGGVVIIPTGLLTTIPHPVIILTTHLILTMSL